MKINQRTLFVLLSILTTSSCYALPFNIFPKPGTSLPTEVVLGQSVTALYTVQNNTGSFRGNNYVKYLPPNVTQVLSDPSIPNLCGAGFNLSPRNTAGDSCTLSLSITGTVNSKDPDPHHHLFVCFPGGKTCAGTLFPLNVVVSSTPPPPPPRTVTLFGVTGDGSPSQPQTLFTLDTSNGNATFVMPLGNGGDGEAIASDGLNLYHWSGSAVTRIFERIDLQNLTVVPIPTTGSNTGEVRGPVFYNSANAFLTTAIGANFFSYTTSGFATLLGSSGIDSIRGMACLNHRIFAIQAVGGLPNIYELDPSNGNILSTTSITLPGFVVLNGQGLTVNPLTGQFYAILTVSAGPPRRLVTIDVTTGIATLIGNADDGTGLLFASIAFHPADPTC